MLFFSRFEAILNHGLKTDASSLSSLKEKVTNLVVTAPSANHVIKSPWPFIRLHLNRHELERYMLLKQVTTDLGRGKAWLRSSLNEHSLERYFHILISDKENLSQFYEGINSFCAKKDRIMYYVFLNSLLGLVKTAGPKIWDA